VRGVASLLATEGGVPGDIVGVSVRAEPVLLLVTIIALARLGAVMLPIHPGAKRSLRRAMAEHFKLRALVSGPDAPGAGDAPVIVAQTGWLQRGAAGAAPPVHPGAEHPWAIGMTSGTTGAPKGVVRSHASFLKLAELQKQHSGFAPDHRVLNQMDLHNGPAIKRALRFLSYGGAVVFLAGTAAPSAQIARHRVTHVYASPITAQNWARDHPAGMPPLDSIQELLVGAGAMLPGLADDITRRLTPNLYLNYGTTETGTIATVDLQTWQKKPGLTGRILPWIEAQVVDRGDRPVASGSRGILRYRGTGVASGYYGVDSATLPPNKTFRDGWFYPGDVGRIAEGGLVYLDGRIDDVLNLGGPKVKATAVETLLGRYPGVREVAVFTMANARGTTFLVAAVVADGPVSAQRINRYYREKGGRYAHLLRVVQTKALPRSPMGKVLKQELKRRIAARAAARGLAKA
jgi:acyl-coenzyme A synthetase/AMP-(fatty) acid ligase